MEPLKLVISHFSLMYGVRSHENSQGSATEVLGSPDHGCGTVCPLNCDSKTFASPSLGGYLRHFCFAETRRIVTSLF